MSVLTEYSRVTLKYCIMLYKAINLNTQKEVIKAARPSLWKQMLACEQKFSKGLLQTTIISWQMNINIQPLQQSTFLPKELSQSRTGRNEQ